MSRPRTGPIYTQDVLNQLKKVAELQPSNNHEEDEAVFKAKTHALQKFLSHGMSRFSIEGLKYILDDLVSSNEDVSDVNFSIRSVRDLRELVKATMTKRESGSLKSTDATGLIYLEHFFFSIYCLTEVKKVFDEMYADLFYSYYNPDNVSRQVTRVQTTLGATKSENAGEDYSQFGILTLEQMTGSTQHKLKLTVNDMNEVLSRWASLLTDDEPQPEDFDHESEQDLLLIRGSSRVEPVVRLLPDIFAKFFKCLELTKQWWVLAHEIYPELPFQRRPPESDESADEDKRVESLSASPQDSADEKSLYDEDALSKEIVEMRKAVRESTGVLKGLEEELEALEKREEKFEILKETYEKVGEDIEIQTKERQELWSFRDKLSKKGESDELDEVEEKIRRQDNALRLLEFQHALLWQDYIIHMEIRPSIIRFHGDITSRVHEARTVMDQQLENLQNLMSESKRGQHDDVRRSESVVTASTTIEGKVNRGRSASLPSQLSDYDVTDNESDKGNIVSKTSDSNKKTLKGIMRNETKKPTRASPPATDIVSEIANTKRQNVALKPQLAGKSVSDKNNVVVSRKHVSNDVARNNRKNEDKKVTSPESDKNRSSAEQAKQPKEAVGIKPRAVPPKLNTNHRRATEPSVHKTVADNSANNNTKTRTGPPDSSVSTSNKALLPKTRRNSVPLQNADSSARKNDTATRKSEDALLSKDDKAVRKDSNALRKDDKATRKTKTDDTFRKDDNALRTDDKAVRKDSNALRKGDKATRKTDDTLPKVDKTARKTEDTLPKVDKTARKTEDAVRPDDNALRKAPGVANVKKKPPPDLPPHDNKIAPARSIPPEVTQLDTKSLAGLKRKAQKRQPTTQS
ncbi:trichohyalin [Aplysia californica]|uniref:Trichohyalin n=1 Tax=Aplysia californica TaxID=6500 RepID=A0ABM0ZZM5_APLCA|nr:trichohyalin [Aplysia californica]